MRSLIACSMKWAGMMGLLLMAAGCATTRLSVVGPPGSVLFIDDKPYHLPATVELSRPAGDSGSSRHRAELVATVQSRELRAHGHIDLFGYRESDLDRMAINTCNLDEANLAKLFDGSVVVFRGQSASRQPLYDLSLTKK